MKIYTPPIITAKDTITVGHGVNLVACDVLARSAANSSTPVEYSFPAWNHHGKMFETRISSQPTCEQIETIEQSLEQRLRTFNLAAFTKYRDCDPFEKERTKDYFKTLFERGFITTGSDQPVLDMAKVLRETALWNILEDVTYFPAESVRKRLQDLARTVNGNYPIGKPRVFATVVQLAGSEHTINPLFDLATSPSRFSERSADYMIDGSRTMLHGTFLPFTIWAALFNEPFSQRVCVHGYLTFDQTVTARKLDDFSKEYGTDVLRACVIECAGSVEDSTINIGRIKKAKKALNKLVNLAQYISRHDLFPEEAPSDVPVDFNVSSVVRAGLDKILQLSSKASNKEWTLGNTTEYFTLLSRLAAFFPESVALARSYLATPRLGLALSPRDPVTKDDLYLNDS